MDKSKIISKFLGDVINTQSNEDYITVTELKTVEKNGLEETIDTNTALISESLVRKIKASQAHPFVSRTGVNYKKDFIYNPSFWIYLSKTSGLVKAEPLVVAWCSGNHTTFCVDQGFLSTYHLTPRLLDKEIIWDDLKKPSYEVVRNRLVSEYNFKHSEAFVKIKRSYLEDYLYLRKKTAIQVFNIKRDVVIDQDITSLLNNNEYFIEEFRQFEIIIRRSNHKENQANVEVNGFKILFPSGVGKREEENIPIEHYWKGINGVITEERARNEMRFDFIYVSDNVLEKYESDDNYDVYPLTGSVSYRNQWAVSYCKRVGRNAIKIEVKKLYEGCSYEVIDYWNQFSISPSEIIDGENIALKAQRLAKNFLFFGRLFTTLTNTLWSFNFVISDVIRLDEEQIEYTGWSEFTEYIYIARHIDLMSFSQDQFIMRCKNLYMLLGENLQEKPLRKIVDYLGFTTKETQGYRSLKLLDCIIKYLIVANESGLDPVNQRGIIIQRVNELRGSKFLSDFFILNDIRQIDAHNITDSKSRLKSALARFEIHPNAVSNNYADTCFLIYDRLNQMLSNLNSLLSGHLNSY